ncbi:hypothetical protein XI06_14215 [Bradyrhizobium sp. CCBAU 11434]|uniref:hypothetical protein n=1 Tax=Bradyrhizobium sp. CCBAU 11434 TaxID=1630885 RepID=UPI002305365E|nr:hypothetical protein [Bradyrhizobium sp. CCBAU 11434]MDA9521474.1 hypothetical protein [Bradyrhizobium sp. CCBAU 11434]
MVFVETPVSAPEPVEAAPVLMPLSEQLSRWIGHFCRVPNGVRKGDRVDLLDEQKQLIKAIYDGLAMEHVVQGDLASYLALAAMCGPAKGYPHVRFVVDDSLIWAAASPELQSIIGRDAQGRLWFSGKAVLTT